MFLIQYLLVSALPYQYYITKNCRNQPHFSRLADWEGITKVSYSYISIHFIVTWTVCCRFVVVHLNN